MIKYVFLGVLSSLLCASVFGQQIRRVPPQQFTFQNLQNDLKGVDHPDTLIRIHSFYGIANHRLFPDTLLAAIQRIEQIEPENSLYKTAHLRFLKGSYYVVQQPDTAAVLLRSAREIFMDIGEKRRAATILNTEAQIQRRLNSYLEAEDLYLKAINLAEEEGFQVNRFIYEISKLYMQVGATDIALDRYQELLEIENNPTQLCNLYLNVSNVYKRERDFDKAVSELIPCSGNDQIPPQLRAAIFRSLSDLERIRDNQQKRLEYVLEAKEIEEQFLRVSPSTITFLAQAYYDVGEIEKASKTLNEIQKIDSRRIQPPTRIQISILRIKLFNEKAEYEKAIKESDIALNLIQRMPESILEIEVSSLKAEAYEKLGNYEKAYQITKALPDIEESIMERVKLREETNSRVRFQMRAKNQELAQMSTELGTVKTRNAIIVILMLMLTGYIIYRYRVHFLLKEERTRNRIASDLHDDLSATLSSISFFSEAAKKQSEIENDGIKFLERIDESAVEAKEKINDIIWSIDPENDDWKAVLTKCKRFAAEMFESKDISYQINIDEDMEIELDIRKRQDFWLIFKELITNLVRHSQASNAEVSVTESKEFVKLMVIDNGVGFDPEATKDGNGVRNIKSRIQNFKDGSDHFIESQNGEGTTWRVSFKK